MKTIAIVVAAGQGSRFGADRPKQFCLLGSRTVLCHAVERMQLAVAPCATVVVVSPGYEAEVPQGCITAYGGATRGESVANALAACRHIAADVIMVHDGARPLPTLQMIREAAEACRSHHGAVPVVDVVDTLRRTDGTPVMRSDFRRVQTPQAFRADLLHKAYAVCGDGTHTDDASVMTAAGYDDIVFTAGHEQCMKITHPLDLEIAAVYLRNER